MPNEALHRIGPKTGLPVSSAVEAVRKVPKMVLGWDAEKSDVTECATINDLMLRKGQVTPENGVLTRQKDFFYRLVRRRRRSPYRSQHG
jgi:hypothetical protein